MLGVFQLRRVVGSCGLHRRIAPDGLELGYWIHPDFTGRGLACTIAERLTQAAFAVPEITHVEIHHDKRRFLRLKSRWKPWTHWRCKAGPTACRRNLSEVVIMGVLIVFGYGPGISHATAGTIRAGWLFPGFSSPERRPARRRGCPLEGQRHRSNGVSV